MKQLFRDLWDNINNICVTLEKKIGAEKHIWRNNGQNFSNLVKTSMYRLKKVRKSQTR